MVAGPRPWCSRHSSIEPCVLPFPIRFGLEENASGNTTSTAAAHGVPHAGPTLNPEETQIALECSLAFAGGSGATAGNRRNLFQSSRPVLSGDETLRMMFSAGGPTIPGGAKPTVPVAPPAARLFRIGRPLILLVAFDREPRRPSLFQHPPSPQRPLAVPRCRFPGSEDDGRQQPLRKLSSRDRQRWTDSLAAGDELDHAGFVQHNLAMVLIATQRLRHSGFDPPIDSRPMRAGAASRLCRSPESPSAVLF